MIFGTVFNKTMIICSFGFPYTVRNSISAAPVISPVLRVIRLPCFLEKEISLMDSSSSDMPLQLATGPGCVSISPQRSNRPTVNPFVAVKSCLG